MNNATDGAVLFCFCKTLKVVGGNQFIKHRVQHSLVCVAVCVCGFLTAFFSLRGDSSCTLRRFQSECRAAAAAAHTSSSSEAQKWTVKVDERLFRVEMRAIRLLKG